MNPEHLEILKSGVKAWNQWRQDNPQTSPDFKDAELGGIHLISANFSDTNLSQASLIDSDICHANLIGANLTKADLTRTNLSDANLSNANLRDANLHRTHLSGADLRSAVLMNTNLHRANLHGASFSQANLNRANLSETELRCAKLIDTNLHGANLSNADLRYAILSQADLSGATLINADLNGVVFDNAVMSQTILADLDLSATKGLESVVHYGPSTVGIDTIYKSQGKIPEVFLRGCGAPDSFIKYIHSLIGAVEGIQFYSCFISYSGKDDEFAQRLHGRLQQEHVRVWFAPEDGQGGKKLHEQIDEAIRIYDKLLIVLSPHSLASEWVMTELRKARKAERKTGKRKLFPLRLVDYDTLQDWECFDDGGGQDLANEVRQYLIPDFSSWKDHDAFEKAFANLLRDLRSEEAAVK